MTHYRIPPVETLRIADRRSGWLAYHQALELLTRHESASALVLLAEAEAMFRTDDDASGQWRALAAQAELHWREGQAPLALARALAALAAAEQLDDPLACGIVAWQTAIIALGLGDYETGKTYLQRAQVCLDDIGTAPPGGLLAAAAQICAEILRWQQAVAGSRIGRSEGEAAIVKAHADLIHCLADAIRLSGAHEAEPTTLWVDLAPHPALPALLPPPAERVSHASLGNRLIHWLQSLFTVQRHTSVSPDNENAPSEPAVTVERANGKEDLPAADAETEEDATPEQETSVEEENAFDDRESSIERAAIAGLPHPSAATIPDPVAEDQPVRHQPGLTVYTFGELRVYYDDVLIDQWEGARSRALFRFLIAHRHMPAPKDLLAAQFWPDSEPELARRSLHQAVYCLRQTFKRYAGSTPIIQFANDRYMLAPEVPLWVDSEDFEESIGAARAFWSNGDTAAALLAYSRAIDLYRGDYMAEDRYEDWAEKRRTALQVANLEALHQLARTYHERGDFAAAIMFSQRALALDSCDEDAHRVLIGCYVAQGLRQLAVRQYQVCVGNLRSQLGLRPSDEFETFFRRVTAGRDGKTSP